MSVGRGQAHCDDEVSIRTKGRRNFDTALQYSAVDMIATEKTTCFNDRYAKAAENYKPHGETCVLFLAESPPASIDGYFYFKDVKRDDWLWIALMKALYPSEWARKPTKKHRACKEKFLLKFQQDGFRLIDAVKEPLSGKRKDRVDRIKSAADELIEETRNIAPKQIVLIKATVHEALFEKFQKAGLPVINERPLPFPASGRAGEFHDEFQRLVDAGKLRTPQLRHGATLQHCGHD